MNKIIEKTIRISLLSIMVIIGLIIVFPQTLELKGFIFEDTKAKLQGQKNKVGSWVNGLPSFGNISPSRRDVKKYILTLENIKRVNCIGEIKETFYSKEDEKKGKSLARLNIKFEAVIERGPDTKLKTSYLIITPKLRSKTYGNWLWPSYKKVFDEWQYQENPNSRSTEKYFKDTLSSNLWAAVKIKKCGY